MMIEAHVISRYMETDCGAAPVRIDDVCVCVFWNLVSSISKEVFHRSLNLWGDGENQRETTTPKLGDRGRTCMFLGYYVQDYAGDCYEMLHMETKRILQTRDVTWLGKMYFQLDDGPEVNVSVNNDDESKLHEGKDVNAVSILRRSERVVNAPRRLIEEIDSDMMIEEVLSVGDGIGGGFEHTSELIPMKYHG